MDFVESYKVNTLGNDFCASIYCIDDPKLKKNVSKLIKEKLSEFQKKGYDTDFSDLKGYDSKSLYKCHVLKNRVLISNAVLVTVLGISIILGASNPILLTMGILLSLDVAYAVYISKKFNEQIDDISKQVWNELPKGCLKAYQKATPWVIDRLCEDLDRKELLTFFKSRLESSHVLFTRNVTDLLRKYNNDKEIVRHLFHSRRINSELDKLFSSNDASILLRIFSEIASSLNHSRFMDYLNKKDKAFFTNINNEILGGLIHILEPHFIVDKFGLERATSVVATIRNSPNARRLKQYLENRDEQIEKRKIQEIVSILNANQFDKLKSYSNDIIEKAFKEFFTKETFKLYTSHRKEEIAKALTKYSVNNAEIADMWLKVIFSSTLIFHSLIQVADTFVQIVYESKNDFYIKKLQEIARGRVNPSSSFEEILSLNREFRDAIITYLLNKAPVELLLNELVFMYLIHYIMFAFPHSWRADHIMSISRRLLAKLQGITKEEKLRLSQFLNKIDKHFPYYTVENLENLRFTFLSLEGTPFSNFWDGITFNIPRRSAHGSSRTHEDTRRTHGESKAYGRRAHDEINDTRPSWNRWDHVIKKYDRRIIDLFTKEINPSAWDILGIPRIDKRSLRTDEDREEIKSRINLVYRKLMRAYHPDKISGDIKALLEKIPKDHKDDPSRLEEPSKVIDGAKNELFYILGLES